MATNKTTTAQIGVVNQVPSPEQLNQYWAEIKFEELFTNYVNENLYDNRLTIRNVDFVGDTIKFDIQWRGIGTQFNYANPDAYLENRAVATTISYILNNKVQYAYAYNAYQQVQDQPNYVDLIARQGQFAFQWFTKYLATLTRYKIYQYCIATGQFVFLPNILQLLPQTTKGLNFGDGQSITIGGNESLAYWFMLNIANRLIKIKTNFNQINYGLPEDSLVFLASWQGYLALTTGSKGWGGSDAAFTVYENGAQTKFFGTETIRDIFLGNVSTEVYNPTKNATTAITMDLSNVNFMIYNKMGAFKCLKPQFAHSFTNSAFTYHEIYMFDAEVFVIPIYGYGFFCVLSNAPSIDEINNARTYLCNTQGYNDFFNSTNLPQITEETYGNFLLSKGWETVITGSNTLLWDNTLNTSINDYGTYAEIGNTPTTSILNQGASLALKIENLQNQNTTTTTSTPTTSTSTIAVNNELPMTQGEINAQEEMEHQANQEVMNNPLEQGNIEEIALNKKGKK